VAFEDPRYGIRRVRCRDMGNGQCKDMGGALEG
jgi:hypothetical protein